MSDRKTKTWQQDWHDSFPFLWGNRGAPFLMILNHADNHRHLKTMLSKWLPPHWWLSTDERKDMLQFWIRWYKDLAMAGSPDWLVRDQVNSICDNLGLCKHYLKRIQPKKVYGDWSIRYLCDHHDHELVHWYQDHMLANLMPIEVVGLRAYLSCYRFRFGLDDPVWYILFNFSKSLITEGVAQVFSAIDVMNAYSTTLGVVHILVKIEGGPLDQSVAEGKRKRGYPQFYCGELVAQPEFTIQLQKVLSDHGLSQFSFLPVAYKEPPRQSTFDPDHDIQGHH